MCLFRRRTSSEQPLFSSHVYRLVLIFLSDEQSSQHNQIDRIRDQLQHGLENKEATDNGSVKIEESEKDAEDLMQDLMD